MTEREQVLQFIKNNGWPQRYLYKYEPQWKGFIVYECLMVGPHECIGRYPLMVLIKDGKIRRATEKEIDKIIEYQSQFYDEDEEDNQYYDMQSLNIISESCLELKEKMKTCSDEKELTLFYDDLIDKKYKKAYEAQLRKSVNK